MNNSSYALLDERGKQFEHQRSHAGQKEHLENFVAAIRGETSLNAEITEGHRSALLCHLGNIAYRTGETLKCDPGNGRIVGDTPAQKMWSREYEDGWKPVV